MIGIERYALIAYLQSEWNPGDFVAVKDSANPRYFTACFDVAKEAINAEDLERYEPLP